MELQLPSYGYVAYVTLTFLRWDTLVTDPCFLRTAKMSIEEVKRDYGEDHVEIDDPLSDLEFAAALLDIGRVVAFDEDVELVPYSANSDSEEDDGLCATCPPGCNRNWGGQEARGMPATIRIERGYARNYECCESCLYEAFDIDDQATGRTRYICLAYECDMDTGACLEAGHCHIDYM